MAAMPRIVDILIGALTAGRCCTQASTSSIPRIATVKDGSSEKPAGKSAAVGMFQRREITTATYLTTGGRFIGKKLQIKIILQNNSVNQETKNVGK